MARVTYVEAKPTNNVYTGILAISLVVMVGVSILLYTEYDQYKKAPDKVNVDVPGQTAAKAGASK